MLQGKLCVIVGAVKELGANVAKQFAAKRCNIAFMDMDKESGRKLKQILTQEYCVEVFFFHGDISSEEDTDLFAGVVMEQYGGVDYFIYNTGMANRIFGLNEETSELSCIKCRCTDRVLWRVMAYPVQGEWKIVF